MPSLFDNPEKVTVRLKQSKVGAIGNINEGDFDPEKHERLSRQELLDIEARARTAGKATEDFPEVVQAPTKPRPELGPKSSQKPA